MDSMIGLGRLPVERDDAELTRYALPRRAREARAVTSKYWLSRGAAFDQGPTSQCVAYSGVRYLVTHPIVNKPLDFAELYRECQKVDEWPGENYDGTSVRALFRVLKSRGLVSEYRWALDCETVINHVLTTGPVVMGTTWTMDLFTPDRWGFIRPGGASVGGHAWTIIGANRRKLDPLTGKLGAVRMINSWGPRWGEQKGRAWVSFSDLDLLIRDDGEACCSVEIRAA